MTIEEDIEEITKVLGWSVPHIGEDGIRRYNSWGGNPEGNKEDPQRCVVEVAEGGRSPLQFQCRRKRGKGPGGLLCGVHLRQMEKIKADRIEWDLKMQLEKEGKVDREIGSIKWKWNDNHTSCVLIITIDNTDAKYGTSIADIGIDDEKKWYATINAKTVGGKFDTPQLAMGFVEREIVNLIRRI